MNLNSHEAAEPPKTGVVPRPRREQVALEVRDCHHLWPYAADSRRPRKGATALRGSMNNHQECGFAEYRVAASWAREPRDKTTLVPVKIGAESTPLTHLPSLRRLRRSLAEELHPQWHQKQRQ